MGKADIWVTLALNKKESFKYRAVEIRPTLLCYNSCIKSIIHNINVYFN